MQRRNRRQTSKAAAIAARKLQLRGEGKREAPVRVELTVTDLQSECKAPDSPEKTQISDTRAALGAARASEVDPIDPDLAKIVANWPTLPDPIKRAMLALVD